MKAHAYRLIDVNYRSAIYEVATTPLTAKQIAVLVNDDNPAFPVLSHQFVSARVHEMVKSGHLEETAVLLDGKPTKAFVKVLPF